MYLASTVIWWRQSSGKCLVNKARSTGEKLCNCVRVILTESWGVSKLGEAVQAKPTEKSNDETKFMTKYSMKGWREFFTNFLNSLRTGHYGRFQQLRTIVWKRQDLSRKKRWWKNRFGPSQSTKIIINRGWDVGWWLRSIKNEGQSRKMFPQLAEDCSQVWQVVKNWRIPLAIRLPLLKTICR